MDSDATVPQIHGFFIAKKNVVVDSRLHIIGGVATDRMESLVEKGCAYNGISPEVSGDKDLSLRDYWSCHWSRDIEIIIED